MTIADEPASYPVAESDLRLRTGRVIDVRTDVVQMPDGGRVSRDVVVHPGAVGIIALDDESRVLLVQQYRHPVGYMMWEPPAGLLDQPGEHPLDAAKRELFEEAHYVAERWDVLVDVFSSAGMTTEALRIYLARGVRAGKGPRHAGENEERDMPTTWLPLHEVAALILDGSLHNSIAVMGILAVTAAQSDGFASLRAADAPWPQMSSFRGSARA